MLGTKLGEDKGKITGERILDTNPSILQKDRQKEEATSGCY